MPDPQPIDRRQFARRLSMMTGAAALVVSEQSSPGAEPEAADSKAAAAAVKPPPTELLLLKVLIDRYPSDNFDEAALKGILSDLRSDVARGRILSEADLSHADQPGLVFRAYRGPE